MHIPSYSCSNESKIRYSYYIYVLAYVRSFSAIILQNGKATSSKNVICVSEYIATMILIMWEENVLPWSWLTKGQRSQYYSHVGQLVTRLGTLHTALHCTACNLASIMYTRYHGDDHQNITILHSYDFNHAAACCTCVVLRVCAVLSSWGLLGWLYVTNCGYD